MARRRKKQLNRFEHPQLSNASKTLFANIRFASLDEPIKTIVVVSSTPNEGKTIVATNLAHAIATSGTRVLIVEADMHYRSLNRLLNLHPEHGIYAALSNSVPLEDVIVPTHIPNLYFMDAEPNIPSPSDILGTKIFAAMVDRLREMFDYVIFDTPPISLFVDAAILSNLADGTLFVVRQNQTKRTLATKCMQQLQVANARTLGLVTTFCEGDDSLYYYAYYTQGGKRVDKKALKRNAQMAEPDASADSELTEPDTMANPDMFEPDYPAESAAFESDASAFEDFESDTSAFEEPPEPYIPIWAREFSEPTDIEEFSEPTTQGTNNAKYAPNAYRELPFVDGRHYKK
jgi:capsular exopolysaccharide synthesis family protein